MMDMPYTQRETVNILEDALCRLIPPTEEENYFDNGTAYHTCDVIKKKIYNNTFENALLKYYRSIFENPRLVGAYCFWFYDDKHYTMKKQCHRFVALSMFVEMMKDKKVWKDFEKFYKFYDQGVYLYAA